MREYRLLERIRNIAKDPDRRGSVDLAAAMGSVLHHVQKILNTRQGAVPIAPDYGVPDFTDIAGSYASDAVQVMEQSLSAVIAKYEPRLKDARVEFEQQQEDVLALRFRIMGKLALEGQDVPVVFESIVQSDGKITVNA